MARLESVPFLLGQREPNEIMAIRGLLRIGAKSGKPKGQWSTLGTFGQPRASGGHVGGKEDPGIPFTEALGNSAAGLQGTLLVQRQCLIGRPQPQADRSRFLG